jgi:hypothetical protein
MATCEYLALQAMKTMGVLGVFVVMELMGMKFLT